MTILIANNNSIDDITGLAKPPVIKDDVNLVDDEEIWIRPAEDPPPITAKNHCNPGLIPSKEIALNKVPAATADGIDITSKKLSNHGK